MRSLNVNLLSVFGEFYMNIATIGRWFSVMKQRLLQDKVSHSKIVYSWHLDSPSANGDCLVSPEGDRLVQGWVLFNSEYLYLIPKSHIVLQWNSDYELVYFLDVERPDVVSRILKETSDSHAQLRCGFKILLPPDASIFNLSLACDDRKIHLAMVHTKPIIKNVIKPKVLEGRDGWLFLDNDTNHSVDQHAGKIRISDKGLREWEVYANDISAYTSSLKSEPVVLVAPTKESVMHQYHPKEKSLTSCLANVFNAIDKLKVVYPVEELAVAGESSFYKTDTHWTHKGASLAAFYSIKALNLPIDDFNRILINDVYKSVNHVGDLGNKFDPHLSSPADILVSFHYRHKICYDNGLPNFGRLLITQNDEAISDSSCLVFGSSSFYSMLSYLCRFFKTLVFVHSAGNVDRSLVNSMSPDYLLVQTNARFMIRPPTNNYNLLEVITKKQNELTEEQIIHQLSIQNISNLDCVHQLGLNPWHQPIQYFISTDKR